MKLLVIDKDSDFLNAIEDSFKNDFELQSILNLANLENITEENLPDAILIDAEQGLDLAALKKQLVSEILQKKGRKNKILCFGNLQIFPHNLEIQIDTQLHQLTLIEYKILKILIENVNTKISREQILQYAWDHTNVEPRTVDVHISQLRKKLHNFNHSIDSRYGGGYILRPKNMTKDLIVK